MAELLNGDLRLWVQPGPGNSYHFLTDVRRDDGWQPGCRWPTRPVASLIPAGTRSQDGAVWFTGQQPYLRWQTEVTPRAAGFWLATTVEVEARTAFNPAMILWLGALDNMNDRQAHTWRQTILRAPTINQQGLTGNDLPACYLYDHATRLESICFFPPDAFAWTATRFYELSMREIMAYRPEACYGLGLVPNGPETQFVFEPGRHRLAWWFTQRYRETVPSPWEAQRTLIEAVEPLLDPVPTRVEGAIGWQAMAERALVDLQDAACWVEVEGRRGLRAYVSGSSAMGRDKARGFELMTQLDVAWPLALWHQATGGSFPNAERVLGLLRDSLEAFYRPEFHFIANNYPPRPGDTFMDTWYFFENALIKWPWFAYLTGDANLRAMFLDALHGATTLAHRTNYLFPLFADAAGWEPRNSLLNVSVGGMYASGHVIAHQMTGDAAHLDEAAAALRTMYQLPPHQLTHEAQQLTFAAAAARYLAKQFPDADWQAIAADFVNLALRMGYWGRDPAAPFYDPRGMFQACASLSYPAFKENVECLIAWPELLRDGIGPTRLLAAFANLQRCHNYAFFDPYLPETRRRGPCPYIPYEDLATSEFRHTAELGKELYGAGEVFWSALLFETLGNVGDPDALCLSLDVPCLELQQFPPAGKRRYLLYDPATGPREVRGTSGQVNWFDNT